MGGGGGGGWFPPGSPFSVPSHASTMQSTSTSKKRGVYMYQPQKVNTPPPRFRRLCCVQLTRCSGSIFQRLYVKPLSAKLPALSVDDFMSLTNATRKNPQEWSTPLINARLSNRAKHVRNACQLSLVTPWASVSVVCDSSSSASRAFSFIAILKAVSVFFIYNLAPTDDVYSVTT